MKRIFIFAFAFIPSLVSWGVDLSCYAVGQPYYDSNSSAWFQPIHCVGTSDGLTEIRLPDNQEDWAEILGGLGVCTNCTAMTPAACESLKSSLGETLDILSFDLSYVMGSKDSISETLDSLGQSYEQVAAEFYFFKSSLQNNSSFYNNVYDDYGNDLENIANYVLALPADISYVKLMADMLSSDLSYVNDDVSALTPIVSQMDCTACKSTPPGSGGGGGSSSGGTTSTGCPCSESINAVKDAVDNCKTKLDQIDYKLQGIFTLLDSWDQHIKDIRQFTQNIRSILVRWDDYLQDDLEAKISEFHTKWTAFPTNFVSVSDFLASSNWTYKVRIDDVQFKALTNILYNLVGSNRVFRVELSQSDFYGLRKVLSEVVSSNALYQISAFSNVLSTVVSSAVSSIVDSSSSSFSNLVSRIETSSSSLSNLLSIVVTNSPSVSSNHCNYTEPYISLSYSNATLFLDREGTDINWLAKGRAIETPSGYSVIDFGEYQSLNWFQRVEFLLGHLAGIFSSTNSAVADFTEEQKEQIEEVSEDTAWSSSTYEGTKSGLESMIKVVKDSISAFNPFKDVFGTPSANYVTLLPDVSVDNALIPDKTFPTVRIDLTESGDGSFSLQDVIQLSHNITTFLAFVFFVVFDVLAIYRFVLALIAINRWYWKIYHSWISTMFNGGGR